MTVPNIGFEIRTAKAKAGANEIKKLLRDIATESKKTRSEVEKEVRLQSRGGQNVAASIRQTASAHREQATQSSRAARELDRLRSSLGGAERASVQTAQATERLRSAQAAGLISGQRAAALQNQIATRFSTSSVKSRELSSQFAVLQSRMTQLGQAATIALGPLSGVASRLTAFISLASGATIFGAAVVAATIGLGAAALGAKKFQDEMIKAAQATGTTVESLSALKFAGEISGATFEELQTALVRFSANLDDFRRGVGEAKLDFEALGIGIRSQDGSLKTTETLLLETATSLSRLEDGTRKTAIAYGIFGRAGARLIPFLNQGEQGIRELMEEARRLGIVVDKEFAQKAEGFNDNMTRMRERALGLKLAIGNELLPVMNNLLAVFAKLAGVNLPDLPTRRLESQIANLERQITQSQSRLGALSSATDPLGRTRSAFDQAVLERSILPEQIKLSRLQSALEDARDALEALRKEGPPKIEAPPEIDEETKKIRKFADETKRLREILGFGLPTTKISVEAQRESFKEITDTLTSFEDEAEAGRDILGETIALEADRAKTIEEIVAKTKEETQAEEELRNARLSSRDVSQIIAELRNEQIDSSDKLIEKLKQERDAFGLSEREQFIGQQLRSIDLSALEADARDAVIQKIREQAGAVFDLEKARRDEEKATRDIEQAARDLGVAFGGAFEKAILDARNFGDAMEAVGEQILRVFTKLLVTDPLNEGITGFLTPLLRSGLSGIFSSIFGGGGVNFDQDSTEGFARGGVGRGLSVARDTIITRPTTFPGAGAMQNLARGGVRVGELDAEAVLPLRRMATGRMGVEAMGGGDRVIINVINNTGAQVRTEQRRTGPNEKEINVFLDEKVSELISGGGKTFRTMKNVFGLDTTLTQR